MGRSDHQPHGIVANIDDRSRFARMRLAADAHSAARTRAEFGVWLERHFDLGAERFSDLLLAVNEALANATEFAYADAARNGTVDVTAAYDGTSDTLAVRVNDRGRWRHSTSEQRQHQLRGRGIPLMRALTDKVTIDRTPHGTHVTLTWTDLTRPRLNA
jgi:serine/threonine-protein kinase RsbW